MAGIFETNTGEYDYHGSTGDSSHDRLVDISASFGNRDKYMSRRLRRMNRRNERRGGREGVARSGLGELLDNILERVDPEPYYEFETEDEYVDEYGSIFDKFRKWMNK